MRAGDLLHALRQRLPTIGGYPVYVADNRSLTPAHPTSITAYAIRRLTFDPKSEELCVWMDYPGPATLPRTPTAREFAECLEPLVHAHADVEVFAAVEVRLQIALQYTTASLPIRDLAGSATPEVLFLSAMGFADLEVWLQR